MSNEPTKVLLEEQAYWKVLTDYLPWTLHGWTYKHVASFFDSSNELIRITGTQRNDIVNALDALGCEWPASGCRS